MIQGELCHPKCARNVSGLSRNGPLVVFQFTFSSGKRKTGNGLNQTRGLRNRDFVLPENVLVLPLYCSFIGFVFKHAVPIMGIAPAFDKQLSLYAYCRYHWARNWNQGKVTFTVLLDDSFVHFTKITCLDCFSCLSSCYTLIRFEYHAELAAFSVWKTLNHSETWKICISAVEPSFIIKASDTHAWTFARLQSVKFLWRFGMQVAFWIFMSILYVLFISIVRWFQDSLCALTQPEDAPELAHLKGKWMKPQRLIEVWKKKRKKCS